MIKALRTNFIAKLICESNLTNQKSDWHYIQKKKLNKF